MRLIDADALMENYGLENATKYGNKDAEQQEHSYSTMMLYEVADMIEDTPTVEAKPVVKGEWKTEFTALLVVYRCSECNCATALGQTNFCPNCGAGMRKKVE